MHMCDRLLLDFDPMIILKASHINFVMTQGGQDMGLPYSISLSISLG